MFKIFKNLGKKELFLLFLLLLQVLVCIYLDLKLPDYMADITTLVETEGSDMAMIWYNGKMMLICAVLSLVFTVAGRYISSIMSSLFAKNLRSKIFNRVEEFNSQEIELFQTESLITRTTNDVQELQNFIAGGMQMFIRTPLMLIWVIIKIFNKSAALLSITALACGVVIGTVVFIVLYVRPKIQMRQKLNDHVNLVMRENMTGIRIVRAYNAVKYEEDKFKKANRTLTQNATDARIAMGVVHPVTRLNHDLLDMAIYLVGASIIVKAGSPAERLALFAEVVSFNNYSSRLLMSFMSLEMIFNMLPRVTVASDRINAVLEEKPDIIDGKLEKSDGKGTVEFKNVNFHYLNEKNDVLHNINFKVEKGQTVAFIGATGCGKSTLVNLVDRFYDVTEGEVLINGINVKDYTLKALHNIIGYAAQKAVLFTGTVRTNTEFGESNNEDGAEMSVEKAVEIAQAKNFVENMDKGYDGFITRGGTNVSGGQKQRLSIARTIYRLPEIYIFDDTFSALDYKTDRELRAALKKETDGVTTIIVAQRIGTIIDADKIFVMDEGRIVAEGTHEELLKNCEIYQEIASTQLSKEELA